MVAVAIFVLGFIAIQVLSGSGERAPGEAPPAAALGSDLQADRGEGTARAAVCV